MRRIAITCLMSSIIVNSVTQGGVIHRRGGVPPLVAPIIAIDDAGVQVRIPDGSVRIIAWDVVRDLEPDMVDPSLGEKLRVARDLWRARSRVQRNDPVLAEPLFERLFAQYRGRTSETAWIVAEGLLRCRLARGAHEMAVIPYLEILRLDRRGINTDRYDMLPPVYDRQTQLCPQLAPVWADVGALGKLRRDLEAFDAQGDEVVAACVDLYALATRMPGSELHNLDDFEALTPTNHEGLELMRMSLQALLEDQDLRSAARQRLLNVDASMPDWTLAWVRVFVGTSFLLESDVALKRQGMVSLAYLPAQFAGTNPYLAGLALARLAQTLDTFGQDAQAKAIRAELVRRFPGHPILFLNDPDANTSDKNDKENA